MENLKMGEVKCTINEQEVMIPYYTNINQVGNLEINICLNKSKSPTLDWCELCIKDKIIKEFFDYHYLEILNITDEQAEDFNFICEKFGLYEYMDLTQIQAYEMLVEKIKEYNGDWEVDFENEHQEKFYIAYSFPKKEYIHCIITNIQRNPKELYFRNKELCDKFINEYEWLLDQFFGV